MTHCLEVDRRRKKGTLEVVCYLWNAFEVSYVYYDSGHVLAKTEVKMKNRTLQNIP